jgi:two-component system C4-dicarboxylate transport sensor histidine kinase DctB
MRAKNPLLLLMALLCALGVVAGSYLAGTWRARTELRLQGQRQLQLMAPDLQSLLQKYETLPFVLGFQPDLIEALAHPSDKAAITRLNSTLQTIQRQAKVGAIYVMDRDGLTIGASNWDQPLGFVGKNFSYRPYFDAALHGKAGRFYGIGTSTSEAGYFIAQPVYRNGSAGGPVAGVVAVKISLADFERTWRSSDDAIVLADRSGVIFLSNRPDWIYRSLQALDAATEQQLAHTQQYMGQRITPLVGHPDLFVTQAVGQLGWQLMLFPRQARVLRTGLQWASAAALLGVAPASTSPGGAPRISRRAAESRRRTGRQNRRTHPAAAHYQSASGKQIRQAAGNRTHAALHAKRTGSDGQAGDAGADGDRYHA